MNPKIIAQFQLTLLALALALFFWWIYPDQNREVRDPLISTGTSTLQLVSFPDTPIEAESAYVYDVRNRKVLFQKNAEVRLPLASLTKLMSALVASNLIPDYMLVRISADDIREQGDSGLFVDEQWGINDLLDYSLITSSNDGMRAVAMIAGAEISSTSTKPINLFIARMNSTARDIGLKNTIFINQSGLDVSMIQSGGYGSARDMVMLVNYILTNKPRLLEATAYSKTNISSEEKNHSATNTNKIIGEIPNILASKTGFTDLSGGNVVTAFNAGLDYPIIVSVLGSSYDGRFTDLNALVSSTLVYLSNKSLTKN